ncbi:PD-(D/E)XK motif protein [Hamadaea sp. NPDC050747]|uniref:PD-(D/E)XK motif protein n=1 Tax=Hamadaea sp. NPDC050747 TaxID=3155789 RepID=UPI00340E1F3B
MMVTEADWAQLEDESHPSGVVTLRLFPRSPHDIFIAVRHPVRQRMLILRVPDRAAEEFARKHGQLPETRGLHLQFAPAQPGTRELQVTLTENVRCEVFNPLVTDMAETAQSAPTAAEALETALERFNQWRNLLQTLAVSGLDVQARRGLFGELYILRKLLQAGVAQQEALNAWTGPNGTSQDFQFPRLAVEVKTGTAVQPQSLVIANERQLDDTGVRHLVLSHLSLDERRGGTGQSLRSLVDELRSLLHSSARPMLDNQLARVGYLAEHVDLYEEPRYTVRALRLWHVSGDFPRITEHELRPGVGECRYSISTAGLEPYSLSEHDLLSMLKENG